MTDVPKVWAFNSKQAPNLKIRVPVNGVKKEVVFENHVFSTTDEALGEALKAAATNYPAIGREVTVIDREAALRRAEAFKAAQPRTVGKGGFNSMSLSSAAAENQRQTLRSELIAGGATEEEADKALAELGNVAAQGSAKVAALEKGIPADNSGTQGLKIVASPLLKSPLKLN